MPFRFLIAGWPIAVLVLAWAFFWWPVLTGDQVLFVRDLNLFGAPSKHYLLQRIADGGFPLWTPYLSTGMPFFADVSNQVAYPLNAVLALGGSTQQALSLFVILHSLMALAGFYTLARALDLSRAAAAWASVMYAFSGYVLSMSDNINYLPAVAWIPLGLAGALHVLRDGQTRWIVMVAVCVACLVLAGDALNAVVLLGAIGVLCVNAAIGERGNATTRVAVVLPVAAGFLAVLLTALQVLPTVELSGLSVRQAGLAYQDLSHWSFPPRRLLEFLHPFFFGAYYPAGEFLAGTLYASRGEAWANSVYLGPVTLLLGLAALRWRFRLALPWLLVFGLSLLLSFGRHLPFFETLMEVTPFFGSQRFPEKLIVWVTLCAVVLAALGAHETLARRVQWSGALSRLSSPWRLGLTVMVPALAFHLLLDLPARTWIPDLAASQTVFWYARGLGGLTHLQVLLLHLGMFLVLILGVLWLKTRWHGRWLTGLLLAAVLDLLWVHHGHVLAAPEALFDDATPPQAVAAIDRDGAGAPPRIYFDDRAFSARQREFISALTPQILAHFESRAEAAERGYRHLFLSLQLRQRLAPNAATLFGIGYLNGRGSPLQPRSHHALERAGLRADPWHLLASSAVAFVVTTASPPDPRWDGVRFETVLTVPAVNLRLLRVAGALPHAFVVDAAQVTEDTMQGVSRIVPRLDERQKRLNLREPGMPGTRGFQVERVRARQSAPEHHVIEVDSAHARAYVVLNESLFPGWSATLDGEPAAVHLMNERFMAVVVPAGRHRVEFRYRSTWLAVGLALSLLGVVLCALLLWRNPRLKA